MGGSGGGGGNGKALAALAIALAVPGTLVSLNELGTVDLFPRFIASEDAREITIPGGTKAPCGIAAPAEITLSADKARRGDTIKVFGSCFHAGERVVLRVHTDEVGSATADSSGHFEQSVTIPESAPPPSFPTAVAATGKSSIKTATAPFTTKA